MGVEMGIRREVGYGSGIDRLRILFLADLEVYNAIPERLNETCCARTEYLHPYEDIVLMTDDVSQRKAKSH